MAECSILISGGGTDTDGLTALPQHVLAPYTFLGQGMEDPATGTIQSMAGQTINPGTSQQTVSCQNKYMTGNVAVNPISLPADYDLREGVNFYGRVGTMRDYSYLAEGRVVFLNGTFSGVLAEGVHQSYKSGGSIGTLSISDGIYFIKDNSSSISNSIWLVPNWSFDLSPFSRLEATFYSYLAIDGKDNVSVTVGFSDPYGSNWKARTTTSWKKNGETNVVSVDLSGETGQGFFEVRASVQAQNSRYTKITKIELFN